MCWFGALSKICVAPFEFIDLEYTFKIQQKNVKKCKFWVIVKKK